VEKVNAKEETIFMISSQVTGIEDTAKSSAKIAQHGNNLMVRAHNLQWVKLFDLNGRLLKHRSVGAENALSLSLIDLEPGVYIVEIGNNGGSHRQRILKR
jgi:putative thiol protease/hemagglutinin prtT